MSKVHIIVYVTDALGFLTLLLWLNVWLVFIILPRVLEKITYSLLDTSLPFNIAI